MNNTSRTITGGLGMIIGGVISIVGLFNEAWLVVVIYGIPIFIIGAIIFFNKKEDQIEQIKKSKDK